MLPLLAIAGCSFDTAPISLRSGVQAPRPPNSDGAAPQAGASAAGSGSVQPDAGAPPANVPPPVDEPVPADASSPDASVPPPVTDAAGAPAADAGVDAGTAPEDAAVAPEGLFDPCDTDADCSAGLVCYGSGFGYCAQPCEESSECFDVDGVDFTCSPNDRACRVDCAEDGTGGVCPQGLTCVEFGSEGRCLPPDVVDGTSDRGLFEPCELANGDDDCADGLSCYRSADSQIDGPGYCTVDCASGRGPASACDDMGMSPAVLECEENSCRFDCTSTPCPDGMICEEIGRVGVCHYLPT